MEGCLIRKSDLKGIRLLFLEKTDDRGEKQTGISRFSRPDSSKR